MSLVTRALGKFLISILLVGCSAEESVITGCDPYGSIYPICNMKTPEDIAALPDGQHLLLVNFGGMMKGTGYLSIFNTNSGHHKKLFPAGTPIQLPEERWGDDNCISPNITTFRPHGSHLHQLTDGRWRYLVVNHGSRESIELFELDLQEKDIRLTWRGCVLAASDTIMNDVVGLSNGDLIFTRMFRSEPSITERVLSVLGFDTGDVWRWDKDNGLEIISGTDAAEPNGLEISPDEKYVYVNMYFESEVWKIQIDTGALIAKAKVSYPDNSAWGQDGSLWIASHSGSILEQAQCLKKPE